MQSSIRILIDLPLQQSNCHTLNVLELSSIILTPAVYCKHKTVIKRSNLFKKQPHEGHLNYAAVEAIEIMLFIYAMIDNQKLEWEKYLIRLINFSYPS